MINSKIAPQAQLLPNKNKQAIIVNILDKKIKEQQFLAKSYSQEIETLLKRKQQLENRFKNWDSNGEGFRRTWQHQSLVNQSRLHHTRTFNKNLSFNNNSILNQSIYFPDSPTKLGKKGSNQSPIRKLQPSNVKSDRKLGKTISLSPQKYNKKQQLEKQIKEIWARLSARENKLPKTSKEDEISDNLWKKIMEEQEQIFKEITVWEDLEIKERCSKQINQRMQRIKQEIFKQKQGIKILKQQHLNKNKQIIKKGYTSKMLQIIALYGGSRKE